MLDKGAILNILCEAGALQLGWALQIYSHVPNRRHGSKKFNTAQKGHQLARVIAVRSKHRGN